MSELDTWTTIYRTSAAEPDPRVELGLRWLRTCVPSYDGPVVLVQGDTGPGNFLYDGDHVTAIVDWELAHLGDPMEDLGWLALRAVQEPFTVLADRLRQYEAASRHTIDRDRIEYHRVFAELRVVILGVGRTAARDSTADVGNALIYGTLHERLFVEAIAEAMGIDLDPSPPTKGSDTPRTWLYDAALAQIRDVIVPRTTDPFAVSRAKGLARILKYLKALDRDARRYEAAELNEIAELLGHRPPDLAAGRSELAVATREGHVNDTALIQHLWRRALRATELAREAMGVLADRKFDPLA
jgi:hypothetical protein